MPCVIEVWALYRSTVLGVQHLRIPGPERAARVCYTIGEQHDATLVVDPAGLPHERAFALVRGSNLYFTSSMDGEVAVDGQTQSLEQLRAAGTCRRRSSTYAYPLRPGARCKVRHNGVTFLVNAVSPGEAIEHRFQSSRRFWSFTGGSFLLAASVLVPTYFATATASVTNIQMEDRWAEHRFVGYEHQPEWSFGAGPWHPLGRPGQGGRGASGVSGHGASTRADEDQGGTGDGSGPGNSGIGHEPSGSGGASGRRGGEGSGGPHGDSQGVGDRGGEPSSPREAGSILSLTNDLPGCRGDEDLLLVEADSYFDLQFAQRSPCDIPQLARNFDPDMMARNAGILGMIQQDSGHFLASPYGAAFAVGNDEEDIWGGLTGTEVGEAFGVGGLGLVGRARGTTPGTGYATRGDGRGDRHARVRQGKARVVGALDHDIIRRIVRAHIGEVRGCYEAGLRRNDNLRGRVAIRFTIGPGGKVGTSKIAKSSLGDSRVKACIANAIKRWKFPKPENSNDVVVNYPFLLDPR